MARVCAIVFNSVSRDSRVLKQAASLAEAGHDVTIIGLADANYSEPKERLDNGVTISRIAVVPGGSRNWLLSLLPVTSRMLQSARRYMRVLGALALMIILIYLRALDDAKTHFELFLDVRIAASGGYVVLNTNLFLRLARGVLAAGIRFVAGSRAPSRARNFASDWLGHFAPGLIHFEVNRRRLPRIRAMIEAVCERQPDVVHCHDVHTLPVGAAVRKRLSCRLVYDAYEIYEDLAQHNPGIARYYRSLHLGCLPIMNAFITINENIAGWYQERYPNIPKPTIVMNAAVKAPSFAYDGRLHKAAGLTDDARILLYQGGFATKRGLECLVSAAEFLPSDWTLVMMGWGRLEARLRDLAEGITERTARQGRKSPVCFVPAAPQKELPLWTAGGTIGVIPYEKVGLNHWYCTPNKLWEFPNAGVPVLVSPFPEMRKLVETHGYGWLLPETQNPEALARQIAGLRDAEIASARAACARFIEVDNWEVYGQRLVALYDELLPTRTETRAPARRETKAGAA